LILLPDVISASLVRHFIKKKGSPLAREKSEGVSGGKSMAQSIVVELLTDIQ
jgi:hypothetical protein